MIPWEKYGFYHEQNRLSIQDKAKAWGKMLAFVICLLLIGNVYYRAGKKNQNMGNKNNIFSGYSEKAKEIFENNICVESDRGYLLIKAQDVLDAIEESLNIIWYGPDQVPPAGGSKESIMVINQADEKVMYDFLDEAWYSSDIPTREANVERWRYPEPKKIK